MIGLSAEKALVNMGGRDSDGEWCVRRNKREGKSGKVKVKEEEKVEEKGLHSKASGEASNLIDSR